MMVDYFPTLKELEFIHQFQDDNYCLEIIAKRLFGNPPTCPKCTSHKMRLYRISTIKAWQCAAKHRFWPQQRTIFHRSAVPLLDWFKAIELIYKSHGAIPAKEIERQIGVSYKTAWRMKDLICSYLRANKDFSYEFSSKQNIGGRAGKKYKARMVQSRHG